MGAVDGPSEAVVKQVSIMVLSTEEGKVPNRLQIHRSSDMPNANIKFFRLYKNILQVPEYEFHIMIFVDTLPLSSRLYLRL